MKRRPDGRWQKRITLPNGKSKLIYSTAASERLAAKDFNDQLLNMRIETKNALLFENVAKQWSEEHFPKMQYNTLKSYKPAYNSAVDFFSGFMITEIKAKDIRRYMNSLVSQNYAFKSVKNKMLVVSLIFKYAVLNEYIEHDPTTVIKAPKNLPKSKRQSATKEDEKIICENTDTLCGVLAYFYLTTGCRRGEALALTPKDVDALSKTVFVNKTIEWVGNAPRVKNAPKTDSGIRRIPISEKMLNLLTPYMNQNFLFQNATGGMLTLKEFEKMWAKYQNETGIKCTPHQLRHSYATLLFDADIDIKTAQRWLGHANINTTLEIYTHLSELKQSESIKKLNDFLTTF